MPDNKLLNHDSCYITGFDLRLNILLPLTALFFLQRLKMLLECVYYVKIMNYGRKEIYTLRII